MATDTPITAPDGRPDVPYRLRNPRTEEGAALLPRRSRSRGGGGGLLPGPGALGWLSMGLGVAACLAPRALGRVSGVGERSDLLRVLGLRELASGVGLLTQRNRTPWLFARVAGDVMDLALLLSAIGPENPHRHRALAALGIVGAITAADVSACGRATMRGQIDTEAHLYSAVVVNKSAEDCYEFWRDASNLPQFMHLIESVDLIDERRARWTIRAPFKMKVRWSAELIADEPSKCLAWRAWDDSGSHHFGEVRFVTAKGVRGTLVQASMRYPSPAGKAVMSVGKLFASDPQSLLREDLRRFKQLIETGEIASTRGQPSGRRSLLGRMLPEGRLSREGGR